MTVHYNICVNKIFKTLRRYRAATSPFLDDAAAHLLSVSDVHSDDARLGKMCHVIKSDCLNSSSFASFHRVLSRRTEEEIAKWEKPKRTNKKKWDAPHVWVTQITWHPSISPPSITLIRKHRAVRELYHVGAKVVYKSLNGNLLSGWSQRTYKHDPQGSVWEGICLGGHDKGLYHWSN